MTDPVTAAKALEATASTALSAVPESVRKDLVGFVGGDWLHEQRVRNIDRLTRRTKEIIAARNVETETPSPSLAEPIIEAARNESREELAEFFAKLLAAAMDPSRKSRVRLEFVELVKQLDPLDAILLEFVHKNPIHQVGSNVDFHATLADRFKRQRMEIEVSIAALSKLDIATSGSASPLYLTPKGQLFMWAVSD